jgi:hypothetical protein
MQAVKTCANTMIAEAVLCVNPKPSEKMIIIIHSLLPSWAGGWGNT